MSTTQVNNNKAEDVAATPASAEPTPALDVRSTVGQMFDDIRFPQYRLASKLVWLQKESHFDKIDLFNCIEEFREFGLNATNDDLSVVIGTSQVYLVIQSLYINLNQRLPKEKSINGPHSVQLLYKWLLAVYDPKQANYMNVFALKVALTLLASNCSFADKLNYLFTLMCDEQGNLVAHKFDLFLQHILAIAGYFETLPLYQYTGELHQEVFDFNKDVTLRLFVEIFRSYENQLDFKSWLVVFHRLVEAQTITHNIKCAVCKVKSFNGFKYVCKKCSNFTMCQQCFWTGKTAGSHKVDKHSCKEYLIDMPKNNLRRSFRKSFRCFPAKQPEIDTPTAFIRNHSVNSTIKKLDLAYIVSSPSSGTPSPRHNQPLVTFHDLPPESPSMPIFDLTAQNELSLITSYLSALNEPGLVENSNKKENVNDQVEDEEDEDDVDSGAITSNNLSDFEQIIDNLESKNRELMKSINGLKTKGEVTKVESQPSVTFHTSDSQVDQLDAANVDVDISPATEADEEAELDQKLKMLEDKRKYLMQEMDNLMKQYNVDPNKLVDIISLTNTNGINSS